MLGSTKLQLAVLASFDPDYDHDDEPRAARPPTTRRLPPARAAAFLAVIKSAVGPAVLYMPKGFQEGGLCFSLGMLVLSFALFSLGATRLLEAWEGCRKSYAAMMGLAFRHKGVLVVRFTIVAQQCGICLTYFIFVATNLRELVMYACPSFAAPSLAQCCLLQVLAYAPLSCIRNMQNFALTNLVANALILYSLVVLAVYGTIEVVEHQPPLASLSLFNKQSFYLFVGTSAFVYEGSAALVVPLQEAVRKDLQPQFSTLYVRTCGMIIVTYIVFGALNWAAYGNWTETVLTVNLHPSPWKASVQLAYSLAVVFTFPLQLFPAIQILKSVGRKWKRARARCGSPSGYATVDNPLATTAPGGEPRPADEAPSRPRRPTMDAVPEIESSPESPDGPPRRGDGKPPRPRTTKLEGNVARFALVVALCLVAIVNVHSRQARRPHRRAPRHPARVHLPAAIHLKLVPDADDGVKLLNRCAITCGALLCLACTGVTVATW
ncbi:amino acid transmembrane transporter [Aureococcus anophagefferens]|nr:amino acid transmembrane transporter [Aureococcus anophagefferens]